MLILPMLRKWKNLHVDDILQMQTIFGEVTEILERKDMERPTELAKQPQGCDICLKDVKFSYKEKEKLS